MKSRKAVKKLMALGIQRNEAAVFARVYGKVKAVRREDLFPDILLLERPVGVVRRELEIVTLRADYHYEQFDRAYVMPREKEAYVKNHLARALADEAVQNQLVEFTRRTEESFLGPITVTRAQIKIVKPE